MTNCPTPIKKKGLTKDLSLGKCLGISPQNLGKCLRNCPQNLEKCLGNCPQNLEKCLGNCPQNLGKCLGNPHKNSFKNFPKKKRFFSQILPSFGRLDKARPKLNLLTLPPQEIRDSTIKRKRKGPLEPLRLDDRGSLVGIKRSRGGGGESSRVKPRPFGELWQPHAPRRTGHVE